ncbi:MAG: hypothetical protein EBU83_00480 [bacterium]|nr:hypothetical protein [Candidatus Aquidulcis sp.]
MDSWHEPFNMNLIISLGRCTSTTSIPWTNSLPLMKATTMLSTTLQRRSLQRSAERRYEAIVTSSRLILFGSGGFAVPSFSAVATDPRFEIVAVVTAPPREAGRRGSPRPTPVDAWASDRDLPILHIERVREAHALAQITPINAEAALLADFGQIIPMTLLSHYRCGIINLHPSLLPRHRGASPIPATILAGDLETGVTTILMDQGVDTGPVLAVQRLPLNATVAAPQLERELAELAADGVSDTLATWIHGGGESHPQATVGVTQTHRITREDGRIGALTPKERALRMWRAYQPWPGIWIEWPRIGNRIRLDVVGDAEHAAALPPGSLTVRDKRLLLLLPGGALELERVTPANGRSMTGAEFARGRQADLETRGRIAE